MFPNSLVSFGIYFLQLQNVLLYYGLGLKFNILGSASGERIGVFFPLFLILQWTA